MLGKKAIMIVWVAGALACAPVGARAQTTSPTAVGFLKTVIRDAWVITAGQRSKAAPGTPVLIGSQLKTLANASLGVTFRDNTSTSFGPDTEMTVDEYLYAPAQGQLRLGTNLVKGSLNYVSGVIAKLKPEAVTVKTPTGIIGVRGKSGGSTMNWSAMPWSGARLAGAVALTALLAACAGPLSYAALLPSPDGTLGQVVYRVNRASSD